MTEGYPPPRYDGEGGEVTAQLRRGVEGPDLVLGSTAVHYLASGSSTEGLFGLYRWDMPGDPGGVAPHFHRSFSESFYILSGDVQIYTGEEWIEAGPGDYAHVPPGGIHAFANHSGASASMLIMFAPGAPREQYFEGLPTLGAMTDDERAEFFRQHDNLYLA